MGDAKQKITTFLTFPGNAEEAMNCYAALFEGARILDLVRFGKGQGGEEGKILTGVLEISGQQFMVMDMEKSMAPAFTWATSLLVDCSDEAEFDVLFGKLSPGGTVMMGPEPVLDLRKVAWVTDRFGVTWQLVFR